MIAAKLKINHEQSSSNPISNYGYSGIGALPQSYMKINNH